MYETILLYRILFGMNFYNFAKEKSKDRDQRMEL